MWITTFWADWFFSSSIVIPGISQHSAPGSKSVKVEVEDLHFLCAMHVLSESTSSCHDWKWSRERLINSDKPKVESDRPEKFWVWWLMNTMINLYYKKGFKLSSTQPACGAENNAATDIQGFRNRCRRCSIPLGKSTVASRDNRL